MGGKIVPDAIKSKVNGLIISIDAKQPKRLKRFLGFSEPNHQIMEMNVTEEEIADTTATAKAKRKVRRAKAAKPAVDLLD